LGERKCSFESLSERSELVTSGALLLFIVSQRRFRNLLGIFDGDISTYIASGNEIRGVTACWSGSGILEYDEVAEAAIATASFQAIWFEFCSFVVGPSNVNLLNI
jgi:hypothetical protein